MSLLKFSPLFLLLALPIVRADYNSDVDNALTVLWDIDAYLATDFCHDYTSGYDTGNYGTGNTVTVTNAPTTITATLPCSTISSDTKTPYTSYTHDYTHEVSTVSSTTTKTFTTYVPLTPPSHPISPN